MTPRMDGFPLSRVDSFNLMLILDKTSNSSLSRLRRSCKDLSEFIEKKNAFFKGKIQVSRIDFLANNETDWRKKMRIMSKRHNTYGLHASFKEDDFCRIKSWVLCLDNLNQEMAIDVLKMLSGRIACANLEYPQVLEKLFTRFPISMGFHGIAIEEENDSDNSRITESSDDISYFNSSESDISRNE